MGILKGSRTCEKASLRARERRATERRQPKAVNDASAEQSEVSLAAPPLCGCFFIAGLLDFGGNSDIYFDF